MDAALLWDAVLAGLRARGWHAVVVEAHKLEDVRGRVAGVLASGELPGATAAGLAQWPAFLWPEDVGTPRSVVVGAAPRPLTRAQLTIDGSPWTVDVPPHYAGYRSLPAELTQAALPLLTQAGYAAASFSPPLKTLAVCGGLARFGRNNIAYVPGLGSYLGLAAFVSDAPPPPDAAWYEPLALDRCEKCNACHRACPTGAVGDDRFLLHTERCLTLANEDPAPFPAWVDPAWHTCAVGCLRCQQVCPENVGAKLVTAPPEVFDDEETAAILAATPRDAYTRHTRVKLERSGLDYSTALIARNLRVLVNRRASSPGAPRGASRR